MLLSVLALVAVVGGAVGGTYAWFIANRSATGTVGNISAQAVGDLEVSTDGNAWGHTYTVKTDNVGLIDVSGDGVDFYRPIVAVGSSNPSSVSFTKVNKVSEANLKKYVFTQSLQFRSTKELSVYLDSTSTMTSKSSPVSTTEDGEISPAVRVALFESDDVKAAPKAYFHNSGDATPVYVTDTTLTDGKLTTDSLSATGAKVLKQGTLVNNELTTDIKADGSPQIVKLGGTADANGYYYGTITMRLWIEGTDSKCVEDYITNTFAANLNFYALDGTAESI